MLADFDVLVIGGGLAGSAAAVLLARSGVRVGLVEQHAGPYHKVCGEFLSTEALHLLCQVGVLPEALGAVPITHVRLAAADSGVACTALPFPALSLTRCCLDEAMLTRADAVGAHLFRGSPVESLTRAGLHDPWHARLRSGKVLTAPQAMLATGKHDLRGFARPPGQQNSLLACKQYFALKPEQAAELRGHVELHVFPGGYAGLQPVEVDPETHTMRANLCLVMEQARYRALGAGWPALLQHVTAHCPLLGDRLREASPLLPKPLALSHIPYGLRPRDASCALPAGLGVETTLWQLGDQALVIPSFTGDGMSLALHTAFVAKGCYDRGVTPREFATTLHQTTSRQILRATAVSRLLLTPFAKPLMEAARPVLPLLMRQLARATRISPRAQRTAGVDEEKRETIPG